MNTLINDVEKLLSRQLYGILATSGETNPHMNLVAFCALENLKTVIFFSPENSEKIDNIKRSPGIALFADNRTNTREDITTVTSVTIYGNASLPGKSEKTAEWLNIYTNKLPHMKSFAALKTNILVKVEIDTIHVVRDLFEVTVIRPDETGAVYKLFHSSRNKMKNFPGNFKNLFINVFFQNSPVEIILAFIIPNS